MKIVVFDIWADYGHFKVPFTTTSPISFPVPSKPTLYGIVGAILGLDKGEYLKYFNDNKWQFSVSVVNPISKIRMVENFINVKVAHDFVSLNPKKSSRTQIRLELLKNPKYRIYCQSEDSKIYSLYDMLKEHKSVYTISLGISELLANFALIGIYDGLINSKPDDFVEINSLLPISSIELIEDIKLLIENRKYIKLNMPVELSSERELLKAEYFLIETNGQTISAKPKDYVFIKEFKKNIVLY